jgi:uncharacterized glyoxalase superfamily metalloenzyme YdcJ
MKTCLPPHRIRARFARALSAMYRREVPKYGTLVELVRRINAETLENRPELRDQLDLGGDLQRLTEERHGAIRLGLPSELNTMRRLFAVMGMLPVGYYDLSEAGIPVHSTAFRPLDIDELNANPFRIFTSLLRLDLIADDDLREQARRLLEQRNIFTPRLLELIDLAERQGGLDEAESGEFVNEALHCFRWHREATVDHDRYQRFLATHRLVADIVCFKGPHINHLTPRTLDIDRVQREMPAAGLDPKTILEGPPPRRHPILLRQTSFKALREPVRFNDGTAGEHRARFGEIEQRGMALTPAGRARYDELLGQVRRAVPDAVAEPGRYYRMLEQLFSEFPDDLDSLRRQGLAYFRYHPGAEPARSDHIDGLLAEGALRLTPITYEDFLPVSAAGIFQSNLDERETQAIRRAPNQQAFEQALGCPVNSEFAHYAAIERASLEHSLQQLGMDERRREALLQTLAGT